MSNAQLASLPANVHALLAARIDRLDPIPRQVLQIAAVIGREAPLAVLSEVSGVSRAEFGDVLRVLRQAELAFDTLRGGDAILNFRHPLIQDVAYRGLLSERRRTLHSAVAKAIQSHFSNRLDEYAGLLAFHLEQAGALREAAQFLIRSSIWVGANDPKQALAAWKKVAEILRKQPAAMDTDYMRMMACGQVVNFGWREGMGADEARGWFEEAAGLATAHKNMRANALIHAAYGRILAATGSADEYAQKVREAQAIAGEASDGSLEVTLSAVLCQALRLSGRLPEALAVNEAALDRIHELGKFERDMLGFDVEIWLLALRGRMIVELGRGEEAVETLDRVIGMDPGKIDPAHRFIPHLAHVEKAWSEKDAALAAAHAAKALEIAEASGTPYVRVYAQWAQGLALSTAGEHAQAASLLRETLDYAREKKAGLENEARLLSDLSSARLAIDMAPRAYELAQEAVAVAQKRNARAEECRARISKAAAARALGRMDEYDADRAEAARLMDETGARLFARALKALEG